MTITTRERRTTRRSTHDIRPHNSFELENWKFESCCGRLECMS
jgi:hypothetical protein